MHDCIDSNSTSYNPSISNKQKEIKYNTEDNAAESLELHNSNLNLAKPLLSRDEKISRTNKILPK